MSVSLLKKCIAEFIGAFAIVFVGCGAIVSGQLVPDSLGHIGVSVCFGLVVMVMVYTLGHVSGAHMNPAVTLAFAVTRHFPKKEILPYILFQCLGTLAASFFLKVQFRELKNLQLGVTQPYDGSFMTALSWEVGLTMILMIVVMSVATDYRAVGNAAGIAIGGTILFEALFAGPICGASMNPARSIGPAIAQGNTEHLLAYIIGPILGALLGSLLYTFIRCETQDKEDVKGCC